MLDLLLTLHCAVRDADMVIAALRAVSPAPIHIRSDAVRGWQFDDASTAERVSGELKRTTLELIIGESILPEALRAVTQARCELPVRWRTAPLLDHGRIA